MSFFQVLWFIGLVATKGAIKGGVTSAALAGALAAAKAIYDYLRKHGKVDKDVVNDILSTVPQAAAKGAVAGAAVGACAAAAGAAFSIAHSHVLAANCHHLPKTVLPDGYNYALRGLPDDLTKLGLTTDPAARQDQFRRIFGPDAHFSFIKRSADARAVERAMHDLVRHKQVCCRFGREVFKLGGYDLGSLFRLTRE